jgi:hypothetical protein
MKNLVDTISGYGNLSSDGRARNPTTEKDKMKEPRRADAAELQNTMTVGQVAQIGSYTFRRRSQHQQWRVEHTTGQCAHSPGSLVEAFFKCREKAQVLAGTRKTTYRSNDPVIK